MTQEPEEFDYVVKPFQTENQVFNRLQTDNSVVLGEVLAGSRNYNCERSHDSLEKLPYNDSLAYVDMKQ